MTREMANMTSEEIATLGAAEQATKEALDRMFPQQDGFWKSTGKAAVQGFVTGASVMGGILAVTALVNAFTNKK